MSQENAPSQVGDGAVNPAPIRCPYITTKQLDRYLIEFLELFRKNGTAANYGALLVESLPVSRPRDLGLYRISRADPWPVSTMTSNPKIEGLYELKKHDLQDKDRNWPEQAEAAFIASSSTTVNLPHFLEALSSGGNLGAQVENLPALYGGVSIRSQLKIKMFPTTIGSTVLRAVSPIGTRDLLNGGYITISTSGSATAMQKSMVELTTVIYHHRGSPKLWIVVPPVESEKLENHIRHEFQELLGKGGGEGHCSQFVKHLSLWITPYLLQSWGVKFNQILLQEKQMLFLFPSSYYWGMSTGFSIVEMKAIAGPKWQLNGYKFCAPRYPLCEAVQPKGVIFTISQRAIDDAVAADATKKAKSKETTRKARSAKRENRSASSSPPSTPEASASNDDEIFPATPTASNVPNNAPSNPRSLIILRKRPRSASPPAASTLPDNHRPVEPTDAEPCPTPSPLDLLQHEIYLLRQQNAHLFATNQALLDREKRYETTLAQHRAYHRHLEAEMAKEVPSVLLWKNAALKAYGLLEERDRRIEELESLLRAEREERARVEAGAEILGVEGWGGESMF